MRIFGLTITREKAAPALSSVDNRGGWWGIIRESVAGAWQNNVEVRVDTVLTYSAVFRCITLISSDIAKMRMRLVEMDGNGIWVETAAPAFSQVLRKPNHYQNRIQFFTQWMESKLIHGNTYALKQRDDRGVVVGMYVLDPRRVKPLVAPDGSVFYQLDADELAHQPETQIVVPARDIIHDRCNTLYHPLVGTSPIYACGVAAVQGLRIQNNSANFFGNGSRPGGVLTAPGAINPDTAGRLKEHWDNNYTGANAGKVAVLGDGLKFEPMTISAVDAQLIEQLKWTAETVCSVFGVPAYKVGVGSPPSYNNIEGLDAQYYAQCLQIHIESIELCLDEGLGLTGVAGKTYGTEFDLDDLLRMDTATLIKAEADAVGAGIKAPNESRSRLNLPPVQGGGTPYLQVQNYSLAALDERDRRSPLANPASDEAVTAPMLDDDEISASSKAYAYAALKDLQPIQGSVF